MLQIQSDLTSSTDAEVRVIIDLLQDAIRRVHALQPPEPRQLVAARIDYDMHLAPRLRQTLEALLTGDSEKQIARRLAISPHTVHVYVKTLYRRFGVSSRAELLARWIHRIA